MRTFEQTHPWISFQCDLRKAGAEFWILLGEAASKCEHISRLLLRPSIAEKLHQIYLAKGVAATTAIEGNTLSEEEVLRAVEGRLDVPRSKEYLKQEVENIIACCNGIVSELAAGSLPRISSELLCGYNQQVLNNLALEEGIVRGKMRTHSVVVGNVYRGAPAEDCPYLLSRLCEWINGPDFQTSADAIPGMEMVYGILKAVVAHLYFTWIHPFGDGNGRTARLLEFHLLLSVGIPSPAAHLFSNHYNQTRAEYARQLNYASKSGGDIIPFIAYAIRGFVDGLRTQLEMIWTQQWDIVWENYVHDLFRSKNSLAEIRQRRLALAIGEHGDWIQTGDIPQLAPQLASAYVQKTAKTLQRDIAILFELGLIEKEGKKIRARHEIILAFLPIRRSNS